MSMSMFVSVFVRSVPCVRNDVLRSEDRHVNEHVNEHFTEHFYQTI